MTKSIVVSFRISPWAFAKALDGIQHYDKSFQGNTLAEIARTAFNHGTNYLTQALPFEPSQRAIDQITLLTTQGKRKQAAAKPIIGSKPLGPVATPPGLIIDPGKMNTIASNSLIQDIQTGSKKSIVTDFTPDDLMKELGLD